MELDNIIIKSFFYVVEFLFCNHRLFGDVVAMILLEYGDDQTLIDVCEEVLKLHRVWGLLLAAARLCFCEMGI